MTRRKPCAGGAGVLVVVVVVVDMLMASAYLVVMWSRAMHGHICLIVHQFYII
jgi:hypothetical protein